MKPISLIYRVDRIISTVLNTVWQPKICDNIKVWAASQPNRFGNVIFEQLLEPKELYASFPNTIEPEIHSRFLQKKERRSPYRSPEKYLAKICDATLVNQSGLIILPDGQYALEPLITKERLTESQEYYSFVRRQLTKIRKEKKRGRYYSLLQLYCNGNNPYHWFHDVLQNLYATIEHLPEDVTYIVPHGLRAWQYESLAAIGIRRAQTCVFPINAVWELETLFFSPTINAIGQDLPDLNEWIRDACYRKFNIDASKIEREQLIYVSRELARGRKIANKSVVEPFLEEQGFQRYFLEKMSFEQIVRLFASARVVISPHGAGVANIIFSQPGTKVIEIFSPRAKQIGTCYWSMSNAMRHDYWYLFGKEVANEKVPGQSNIEVSIDKITQVLHADR